MPAHYSVHVLALLFTYALVTLRPDRKPDWLSSTAVKDNHQGMPLHKAVLAYRINRFVPEVQVAVHLAFKNASVHYTSSSSVPSRTPKISSWQV